MTFLNPATDIKGDTIPRGFQANRREGVQANCGGRKKDFATLICSAAYGVAPFTREFQRQTGPDMLQSMQTSRSNAGRRGLIKHSYTFHKIEKGQ